MIVISEHEQSRREFWKAVYLAAMKKPNGYDPVKRADLALKLFDDKFKPVSVTVDIPENKKCWYARGNDGVCMDKDCLTKCNLYKEIKS